MWGVLLTEFEAALASTDNVAASQASASNSPSLGRRQPAHWLWCLLCLEADAQNDPQDGLLPGTYHCSGALQSKYCRERRGGCTVQGMSGQGQKVESPSLII